MRHLRRSPGEFFRTKANDGVVAIEFAFIVPVLLLMIMGAIELGLIFFATTLLDSATADTARLGKTGYTGASISREQTILNHLNDKAGSLMDVSKITITTLVYSSFQNINKPEPYTDSNGNDVYNMGEPFSDVNGNGQWDADMGSQGLGGANDVVVYTVSYPWPIFTPLMQQIMGTQGILALTSRIAVKNEPYDTL